MGEERPPAEPGDWACFRVDGTFALAEALEGSDSVGYVESRNDDGTLRVTIYGPDGEPGVTVSRVPPSALLRCRRPPWGVSTQTIRRSTNADQDRERESG